MQVLYRTGGGENWMTQALVADDMLSLPEAGIEVPVSEFYEHVAFDEAPASS